jgi:hypothetical protein
MNIDIEHIHYWMNAVRISEDRDSTLEAFWKGQLRSKEWLIDALKSTLSFDSNRPIRIDIHGGWVGTLASMLFCSEIPIRYIESSDIDPTCEPIATMLNKLEEQDGKFKAVTMDMCDTFIHGDIVINTSCEHITQETYDKWLSRIPKGKLIVLQSNNYKIPEHIRTADTLEQFKEQSNLTSVFAGTLPLPSYNRFMLIGYSNV